MVNFFGYLGLAVLGTVLGVVIVAGGLWTYDWFLQKKIKKKIPTDKAELADPGKPKEIDVKEVQENERRDIAKHREFERLHQLTIDAANGARTNGKRPSDPQAKRSIEGRSDLPIEPLSRVSGSPRDIAVELKDNKRESGFSNPEDL